MKIPHGMHNCKSNKATQIGVLINLVKQDVGSSLINRDAPEKQNMSFLQSTIHKGIYRPAQTHIKSVHDDYKSSSSNMQPDTKRSVRISFANHHSITN